MEAEEVVAEEEVWSRLAIMHDDAASSSSSS
jgi:hypothetical protein